MTWLWILFAALVGAAGVSRWARGHSSRGPGGTPRVDDDALRRILETGTLEADDDEPLDPRAAARAEEEFWSESWDEPEEHRP